MSNLSDLALTDFSGIEITRAESILRQIAPSELVEVNYYGIEAYGEKYDSKFNGSKIKKSRFKKCSFSEVSFIGTAGAASSFNECSFVDCKIENSCFDFADFTNSRWKGKQSKSDISGSSFSHTNFSGTTIDNTIFGGCNFEGSYFKDSTLRQNDYKHCSFENACFENTVFQNVNMSQACIDFSTIGNAVFEDSILPFVGILHTFGGLQNAEKYSDNITIKSTESNLEMTFGQYVSRLEDIQAYFYKINDFFALATMHIHFGNHDAAYRYIGNGLQYSLNNKDFRMIGYYCKLASLNHFFTKEQLRKIYKNMQSSTVMKNMTSHEYQIYIYEMDRIKRMLIDNPFGLPQIKISLTTDILPEDTKNISNLLDYLNTAIKEYAPQSSNYLSLRHNSPTAVDIFLSDTFQSLYYFIIMFSGCLFGLTTTISKFQKIVHDYYDTESIKTDLELKKIKLENARRRQNNSNNSESTMLKSVSTGQSDHCTEERVKSLNFSIRSNAELSEGLREGSLNRDDNPNKKVP